MLNFLNYVPAVCVAAAVVVVFATIFGAVELLWKVLHAARRVSGLERWRRNSPRTRCPSVSGGSWP